MRFTNGLILTNHKGEDMNNFSRFLLLLVTFALTSFSTPAASVVETASYNFDPNQVFIPADGREAKIEVEIFRDPKLETVDIRTLSQTELRKFLQNIDQKVVISKVDRNGKLTFMTGSLAGEKGKYWAYVDFANYFIDDLIDEHGNVIGEAKIGVGTRMIAKVKTNKSGIDLGSILKIGFAASKSELSGSLEVKILGVSGGEILKAVPGSFPTINDAAIQSALESMAVIKSKLYDDDSWLKPAILSVKPKVSPAGTISKALPSPDIE